MNTQNLIAFPERAREVRQSKKNLKLKFLQVTELQSRLTLQRVESTHDGICGLSIFDVTINFIWRLHINLGM